MSWAACSAPSCSRKRGGAGRAARSAPPSFKQVEDRAVDEAVRLQEDAGLDVITDGELRRYAFFGHLIDALDGFDKLGGWAIPFHNEAGEELVFKRPVVVEQAALAAQHVRRGARLPARAATDAGRSRSR